MTRESSDYGGSGGSVTLHMTRWCVTVTCHTVCPSLVTSSRVRGVRFQPMGDSAQDTALLELMRRSYFGVLEYLAFGEHMLLADTKTQWEGAEPEPVSSDTKSRSRVLDMEESCHGAHPRK